MRQIKDAEGNFPVDPQDKEVVIPAGVRATRTLTDIPAGTYRIEARLPSGEVLRQTREVTDGEAVDVTFEGDHSPGDWLSWQRFAGNVPSQKEYEVWITELAEQMVRAAKAKEDASKPIEIDKTFIQGLAALVRNLHLKVQPAIKSLSGIAAKMGGGVFETSAGDAAKTGPAPASPPEPQAAAETAEFELLQANPLAAGDLWDAVASLPAWTAWRKTASRHDGYTADRRDDRQLTLWQITQVDRAGLAVTAPSGTRMPMRCLAIMQRGNGVDVIMLPVPWPLDSDLPAVGLEILREAGTSESGRTSVTVRDDVVGSLIMYLNNGQMADAATVLTEAVRTGLVEELISEKTRNPLAACAAAYVGIATLSGDEQPHWVLWLENLKNRFEWLPDGAIVHAAYLIRTAQTRSDFDIALASLKDAYRRGIPFYTAGLRHLMNGLYRFSATDAEAKAMHEKVMAVASRVDPNQAFNLITIHAPSS
ncbi:MAG: hypothetical protein WA418_31255 [Bradyrhizobium sp.]